MNSFSTFLSAGNGARWFQHQCHSERYTLPDRDQSRQKLCGHLRNYGDQYNCNTAIVLADMLASCSPDQPCLSGACACCVAAAQNVFVMVSKQLDQLLPPQRATSVIDYRCMNQQLEPGSMHAFADRLQSALRRAGVRFAYGGFDISANEHEHQLFAPHYQLQAWLFFEGRFRKRAREQLKRAFPRKLPQISKPVWSKSFDGRDQGRAYAIKPEYSRRVSLSPKPGTSRTVRPCPLRVAQKIELALYLHSEGLDRRLFLHGIKLNEQERSIS